MADLLEQATIARFNGHCELCDVPIIRDCDSIVCIEGDWVHAQCAEDHGLEPEPVHRPEWRKPAWWEDM